MMIGCTRAKTLVESLLKKKNPSTLLVLSVLKFTRGTFSSRHEYSLPAGFVHGQHGAKGVAGVHGAPPLAFPRPHHTVLGPQHPARKQGSGKNQYGRRSKRECRHHARAREGLQFKRYATRNSRQFLEVVQSSTGRNCDIEQEENILFNASLIDSKI